MLANIVFMLMKNNLMFMIIDLNVLYLRSLEIQFRGAEIGFD